MASVHWAGAVCWPAVRKAMTSVTSCWERPAAIGGHLAGGERLAEEGGLCVWIEASVAARVVPGLSWHGAQALA